MPSEDIWAKLLRGGQAESVAPWCTASLFIAVGSPIWALVERYRQKDPHIVFQMELMIAEFTRLTVLLYEECQSALSDIQVRKFRSVVPLASFPTMVRVIRSISVA
jgi:hypothetical protein